MVTIEQKSKIVRIVFFNKSASVHPKLSFWMRLFLICWWGDGYGGAGDEWVYLAKIGIFCERFSLKCSIQIADTLLGGSPIRNWFRVLLKPGTIYLLYGHFWIFRRRGGCGQTITPFIIHQDPRCSLSILLLMCDHTNAVEAISHFLFTPQSSQFPTNPSNSCT